MTDVRENYHAGVEGVLWLKGCLVVVGGVRGSHIVRVERAVLQEWSVGEVPLAGVDWGERAIS